MFNLFCFAHLSRKTQSTKHSRRVQSKLNYYRLKMESVKERKKSKTTKRFHAQISCPCKKNCANLIDIVSQGEFFRSYQNLKTWSQKTLFLRSIVVRESSKENLNPRQAIKKKSHFSSFYLVDTNGKKQKVCASFVAKMLQVNRTKIFRAVQ